MGIKELLKKIRKEKAEIGEEIHRLKKIIQEKENDPNVFMANTIWERDQIKRLREKL